MGYPRAVHYAGALAALVLGGCDPVARQSDIDESRQATELRLLNLEARVSDLEAELAEARRISQENDNAIGAIARQVANNADIANDNAVRDMTRRGACGQRLVQVAEGVIRNENIPCTRADLAP